MSSVLAAFQISMIIGYQRNYNNWSIPRDIISFDLNCDWVIFKPLSACRYSFFSACSLKCASGPQEFGLFIFNKYKISSKNGGQKHWLFIFSLHCLCSSISHLFISRLRLVYWSTLKIANDFSIFAFIMHLLLFLSPDWLTFCHVIISLIWIHSVLLFIFCFSLTKGQCSKR